VEYSLPPQNERPPSSQYTYNAPGRTDISDYSDFISDLRAEFERFGRALAGEVQIRRPDPDRRGSFIVEWVPKFKPVMNDEGIFRLKTLLQDTVATKNTFFSDSSSEQADNLIRANFKLIRSFLFINRRRFELDLENFSYACGGAANITVFAIRRSIGAKTLNATSGSVQTRYDFIGQEDKKKKGILGGDIFS